MDESYKDDDFEQSECINDQNEFLGQEHSEIDHKDLIECHICQRKFHTERIDKHQEICQKAKQKQIERDTRIKKKQALKEQQKQKLLQQDKQIKNKTVNNWREQHKQFQEMIHSNKNNDHDQRELKTPEIVINSHYVYCENCQRHFAPNVAEKHIPKCKEIKARPKPPQKRDISKTTNSAPNNVGIIMEGNENGRHSFRPLGLMKTAEMQKRQLPEIKKAIYTGLGFMDCQTRAIALSDTECPHCNRKFNQKAASRHIPICEKLTSREMFKLKLNNRQSVPIHKKNDHLLPIIIGQRPPLKKILKDIDVQLVNQTTKFCTQCGNKLQQCHKYCGGCGHKREIE